ncbi:MAG: hypothetical protein KAI70_00565 [Candidatus Omnitrophica bacterium]|nr:hypothetical protein [Candidatus Omnitrophota bacterium]
MKPSILTQKLHELYGSALTYNEMEPMIGTEIRNCVVDNGEFPTEIEIDLNYISIYDHNGDTVDNPSLQDLIDNDFGTVSTVVPIPANQYYDDDYHVVAAATKVCKSIAIYSTQIIFSPGGKHEKVS